MLKQCLSMNSVNKCTGPETVYNIIHFKFRSAGDINTDNAKDVGKWDIILKNDWLHQCTNTLTFYLITENELERLKIEILQNCN